jgi:hypothetical protein
VVTEEDRVITPPNGESPEMAQARQTIEAEGGTVEEATPQAIAEVVNEQQPVVSAGDGVHVEDSPTAPPVQDGKRVLSVTEQQNMTPIEVRELVQTGEVILEQDLAGCRSDSETNSSFCWEGDNKLGGWSKSSSPPPRVGLLYYFRKSESGEFRVEDSPDRQRWSWVPLAGDPG